MNYFIAESKFCVVAKCCDLLCSLVLLEPPEHVVDGLDVATIALTSLESLAGVVRHPM